MAWSAAGQQRYVAACVDQPRRLHTYHQRKGDRCRDRHGGSEGHHHRFTLDVTGYGFGSYVYDNDMLCFTGFVPNALHRQIALPNLYFACAARARAMSLWLLDADWDGASFSPEHSAIGRKLMSDNNNE